MSQHLPISCPKCGLDLSVRVENLGRKGICKHCGHVFRAQLADILELLPVLVGQPGQTSGGGGEGGESQGQARELEQIRTLLAAQPSGYADALQRIDDMEGRIVQYQGAGLGLKGPAAPAGERDGSTAGPVEEWETGEPEDDEAVARGDRTGSRGVRARDQEIETLRNERNRLWGEAQDARARMDAQAAENSARSTRLAADRDAARAEAERSGAERAALARDLEQTREQLDAERDSLTQEADRLRNEVRALERSRAEAEAEHDRARQAGEQTLREREERWGQQRRELEAEAERKVGLLAGRLETEQQAALRNREEHARVSEERARFAREVGQLRDRLGEVEGARSRAESELAAVLGRREEERRELEARWEEAERKRLGEAEIKAGRTLLAERERWAAERDALSREVEHLRAEAEAAVKDARERWGRERSDLEAHWGLERQNLRDEAERRLLEERTQFDEELDAWRTRLEKSERTGVERDRLAGEAEEARDRVAAERDVLLQELGELRSRLEVSERSRSAGETQLAEALARRDAERQATEERWNLERRDLTARLHTGGQHLEEIDRLVDERDGLKQEADGLRNRLEESERLRAEERRELEGKWELRFQEMHAANERTLAEQREAFEAERRSSREQAEADRESPRKEVEALRGRLDAVQRERDGSLRDVSTIALERDRLRARLGEFEAALQRSEQTRRAERDRLAAALEQARLESVSAARLGAERAEEVRTQRAELEQRRRDREDLGRQYQRKLESARREWSVERQRWLELLDAARPFALGKGRAHRAVDLYPPENAEGPLPEVSDPASAKSNAAPEDGGPTAAPPAGRKWRRQAPEGGLPVPPRPQPTTYQNLGDFRADLGRWLAEAQANLQEITANPDRPGSETWTAWLRYEMRTARAELDLLTGVPGPGQPTPEVPATPPGAG